MIDTPVMFAIAYRFQEEVWVNFKNEADTNMLNFECLLPTERLAKDYIEEVLSDDYAVVPVKIIKYHNGVHGFEHDGLGEWAS